MQALIQKGGSRLLANLPKEEDRRIPLKKLLESMKEIQDEGAALQRLPPRSTSMPPSTPQAHNGHLRSVSEAALCALLPSMGATNAPASQDVHVASRHRGERGSAYTLPGSEEQGLEACHLSFQHQSSRVGTRVKPKAGEAGVCCERQQPWKRSRTTTCRQCVLQTCLSAFQTLKPGQG